MIKRRNFIMGSGSTIFTGLYPVVTFAETASTYFSLLWRGLDVGFSSIKIKRSGKRVVANIEVKISVKVLNFDAFSYNLKNEEVWESGILKKISSETIIGKKVEFVKGIRKKNGFNIEGSKYSGLVGGNPATTSYFSPEFLKRKTWISTQDGDPLSVSATKIGPDMAKATNGEIPATLWKISGDLDLDLLYGEDGKWLGSRFYAGGSQAEFLLQKSVGNMHSLWKV